MGIFDSDREYRAIERRLGKIEDQLSALKHQIAQQGKLIMSRQTELETALTALEATVVRIGTDITNQLAIITAPGTPDDVVDAALARIAVLAETLTAKAVDLEADDPPAPPTP